MPSFLYLWQRFFSRFEYLYFVCCLWKKNRSLDSDSADSSEHGSTDSGIVIMSHLIEREQSIDGDDTDVTMLPLDSGSVDATTPSNGTELLTDNNSRGVSDRIETGMKKMTVAIQKFVFKYISWPIVYVRVPLLCVFTILLVASVITSSFLRPTHQAPQFMDSNSNIQKLLDLQSEVSQQTDYDCWNCSAFFVMQAADGTLPTGIPPTGGTTVLPHPSSSSSSSSSSGDTHHNTGAATSTTAKIRPSSTTAGKTSSSIRISTTTQHIKPTTTTTTTTSRSTHSTSSTRYTKPTQPTRSSTTTSSSHHKTTSGPTATPATLPPSKCSGDNYDQCINNQADKPAFSGSAVVYVVFGISGIIRTFSPSHVITQENNLVSGCLVSF